MKIKIVIICALFLSINAYSQNVEILEDVRNKKLEPYNLFTAGDYFCYSYKEKENKKWVVINSKNKEMKSTLLGDIKSKDVSKNKNTTYVNIFGGCNSEDGNLSVVGITKISEKQYLSKLVFDNDLGILEEKIIIERNTAAVQYDEKTELFVGLQYDLENSGESQIRVFLIDKECNVIMDEETKIKLSIKPNTEIYTHELIKTMKIINSETVLLNIQGALYLFQGGELKRLTIQPKYEINSYVIEANDKDGVRLIGACVPEFGKAGKLVVIDFNSNLEVTNEKYIEIPESLEKSAKEITGNGEKFISSSYQIIGANVGSNGTTDLIYTSVFDNQSLNIVFVKLDEDFGITKSYVMPYYGIYAIEPIFEKDELLVFYSPRDKWFNKEGNYIPDTYPNVKSNNFVLASLKLNRDSYTDPKVNQIIVNDAKEGEFDWKAERLKFHNLKLDDNTYVVSIKVSGLETIGKQYFTRYFGKIQF